MWIIKIKCFYPIRILDEHWCIYSCLQIPPRDNWFQYVRRVYTTAINFPCIITSIFCQGEGWDSGENIVKMNKLFIIIVWCRGWVNSGKNILKKKKSLLFYNFFPIKRPSRLGKYFGLKGVFAKNEKLKIDCAYFLPRKQWRK